METVRLPPGQAFSWIGRERLTQGKIYVVWPPVGPQWVGQSIPRIVEAYNKELRKAVWATNLYRLVRGEQKKERHNGARVSIVTLEQLNEAVRGGASVVTESPELWRIHSVLDELE